MRLSSNWILRGHQMLHKIIQNITFAVDRTIPMAIQEALTGLCKLKKRKEDSASLEGDVLTQALCIPGEVVKHRSN